MPSRALYTALAFVTSDTGCSTVLIAGVEASVMVTPEVVGLCGMSDLRRAASREIDSGSPFGAIDREPVGSRASMEAISRPPFRRLLAGASWTYGQIKSLTGEWLFDRRFGVETNRIVPLQHL